MLEILALAQAVGPLARPRELVTSRVDKGLKRQLPDEDMDKDSFSGTEIGNLFWSTTMTSNIAPKQEHGRTAELYVPEIM